MNASNRQSGFTLLEMVIVMGLIALLAGAILPAAGSIIRSKARRSTLDELDLMSEAVQEYYRDTRRFPANPLDLLGNNVSGWSGPYMRGTVDDPWSGQSGYAIDGFGNAYTFSTNGLVLTITSDGPDRTSATADDLQLLINVTPILREMTLDELTAINTAVDQYNSVYLSTSPLPGNYPAALATLEANGYLPPGAGFNTDEWGDAYSGYPPGVSPLTVVISTNVGP